LDNLKQLNHQQVLNSAILQLHVTDFCCKIKKTMKDVNPGINLCHPCIMTYAQFSWQYVTSAYHYTVNPGVKPLLVAP
jgi:ribosomal protein L37AE/L43A